MMTGIPSWRVRCGLALATGSFLVQFSSPTIAQVGSVQLVGVTPQQAVIQYTAPDTEPCTLQVTDQSGLGVTVWDVDGTVFAGSDVDLNRPNTVTSERGLRRRVVLGKRSAEPGSDGRFYSRSLQADTRHLVSVTCTSGTETLPFKTLNIPVGNMAPDPPAFHSAGFGNAAWPTIDWTDRDTPYIDPKTGVLLRPASWLDDITFLSSDLLFNKRYDANGTWTDAANILSGSTSQLASSSTTDPIFVSLNPSTPSGSSNWVGDSVADLRVKFNGNGGGSAQQVDFCLTADSGQTCLSAVQSVNLPSSNGTVPFPAGTFPQAPFSGWSIETWPQHNLVMPVATTVNTTGSTLTNLAAVPTAKGLFPTNLAPGSKVVVAGSPCPDELCTVASMGSASQMKLVEDVGALSGAAFTMANFGLRVWKHDATGTVNLSLSYDIAYTATPHFLISDGASDQCNRNPVTFTENAAGDTVPAYSALLCVLQFESRVVMYAFVPDSGEMWPVGMVYTFFGSGFGNATTPRIPQNPWGRTDSRTIYGQGFHSSSAPEVVRWVYRGNGKRYTPGALPATGVYSSVPNGQSDGETSCQAGEQQAGNLCAFMVTDPDAGHDLRAQANALNPHMSQGAFGNNPIPTTVVGNQLALHWRIQQDGITMFTYVNLDTGVMSAATDTMWSVPNARWGGMHTAAGWVIADRYHLASNNPLGSRGNSGPFAGPYKSLVSFIWRSTDGVTGSWDADTSLTADYDYSCPASECGTAVPDSLRLRISGMPCSASANMDERTNYPCPWDPNQGMPDPLRVGDLLGDLSQPGAGVFSEEMEILKITTNSDTDVELWVHRFDSNRGTFANGWSASPYPSFSCTSSSWWYDATGPNTAVLPDDCTLAGHIDVGPGPGITFSESSTLRAKFGLSPGAAGIATPLYSLGAFGRWAGLSGNTNFPGNGRVELYPSLRQWTAPDSEKVWAADWRAYQGGAFVTDGGGTVNDSIGFVPVTTGGRTHVWKVSSSYPSLPKLLPMESWAGRFIFQDKSGPNSNLTDADVWSYCVVFLAGECISGASTVPGEVYMSSPVAITSAGSCYTNHFEAALPCIVPASPIGTWAVQHDISVNDSSSWRFRRLTMAFNAPARQYTATNWRPMPDARWGLMLTTYADGVFPVMFAAKLPPWPGYDNIRRDDFMPQPMRLAPGAALAEVRFGYEENGAVSAFRCTTRREACVSGSPAPFRYLISDGHAGTSCALGCTIPVPALPGRVLWWQEYRSGDGGVTWSPQGPLQSIAVN